MRNTSLSIAVVIYFLHFSTINTLCKIFSASTSSRAVSSIVKQSSLSPIFTVKSFVNVSNSYIVANNPQLHQQYMQRQAPATQRQQMMFMHQQSQQNGGPQANPGNPGTNQGQFGNPDIRQVQLTEHLQREQFRAQQQQHVQQQQQQQQNQLAQQRMAMQQVASQAGNTQGQPAPQNMRPQPPMHGGPEVQAAALAQQEAQRQANIQAQQQQQQQQAQAAAQLQQQHNQNQQAQLQQQQQQAHAQQAAAMMQQPRAQNVPRGSFITKLLQFGIHLSQFSVSANSWR